MIENWSLSGQLYDGSALIMWIDWIDFMNLFELCMLHIADLSAKIKLKHNFVSIFVHLFSYVTYLPFQNS